jgi:hypothetical protein
LEGDGVGTTDDGELDPKDGPGDEGVGVTLDPVGPGVLDVGDEVAEEGDTDGCGLGGTGLITPSSVGLLLDSTVGEIELSDKEGEGVFDVGGADGSEGMLVGKGVTTLGVKEGA